MTIAIRNPHKFDKLIKGGGGRGYQADFFGNINFEIAIAQQGPYMYQHLGEVSGPWRPRPAQPAHSHARPNNRVFSVVTVFDALKWAYNPNHSPNLDASPNH